MVSGTHATATFRVASASPAGLPRELRPNSYSSPCAGKSGVREASPCAVGRDVAAASQKNAVAITSGSVDVSSLLPPSRNDLEAVKAYSANLRAWVEAQVDSRLGYHMRNGFESEIAQASRQSASALEACDRLQSAVTFLQNCVESELATASRQSGNAMAACDRLQAELATVANSEAKLLALVEGMSAELKVLKAGREGDTFRGVQLAEESSAVVARLSAQEARVEQLRRSVDAALRLGSEKEAAAAEADAHRRRAEADCREALLAVEKMASTVEELQQSLAKEETLRLSATSSDRTSLSNLTALFGRLEGEVVETRRSQERQQQRLEHMEARLGDVQRRSSADESSLRDLHMQMVSLTSEVQRKDRIFGKDSGKDLDVASVRHLQLLREELELKLSRLRSEIALEVSKELASKADQTTGRLEEDVDKMLSLTEQRLEESAALQGDIGERLGAQVRTACGEVEALGEAHGELKGRVGNLEKELRIRISSIEADQKNQLDDLQIRSERVATQLQTNIQSFEDKLERLVEVAIHERRGRFEAELRAELDGRLASASDQLASRAEVVAAAGARAEWRDLQDDLSELKRHLTAELRAEKDAILRTEASTVARLEEQLWLLDQRLGQRIDEKALRAEASAAAEARGEAETRKSSSVRELQEQVSLFDEFRSEIRASQKRMEKGLESRLEDTLCELQRQLGSELRVETDRILRSESSAVAALDEQLWLTDQRLGQRIDELTHLHYAMDGSALAHRRLKCDVKQVASRHGGVGKTLSLRDGDNGVGSTPPND